MGRDGDSYIEAAIEALNTYGPADRTLGYTANAATELAGVSRSTVYRHWESIDVFNDDVARCSATARDGWQRRILGGDPAEELDAAITRAIGNPAEDLGVVHRTIVSVWPATSVARAEILSWERDWLDAFARWITLHLAHRGRVFRDGLRPADAAIGLCALIDGTLFLERCRTAGTFAGWDDGGGDLLALAADSFLAELTDPAAADDPPPTVAPPTCPPPVPYSNPSSAVPSILETVCEQTVVRAASTPTPPPRRLVDMARLARRLGVTERRLFSLWPTAASLNADLVQRLVAWDQELIVAALTVLVTEGLVSDPAERRRAIVAAMHEATVAPLRAIPARAGCYALTCADPDVAARFVPDVAEFENNRMMFLSLQAVAGWRPHPTISVDDAVRLAMNSGGALHRLTSVLPALVDATMRCEDFEGPMIGHLNYRLCAAVSDVGDGHRDQLGG